MRGLERAVKGTVLCAALLGVSSGALGAAGAIKTDVLPLSSNVTYSSPATAKSPALKTFIGYSASMTNISPNTINAVSFVGTIYPTDPAEQVQFSSAEGATCSLGGTPPADAPANAVTVTCSFGQFKAGVTSLPFALFFVAPEKAGTISTDDLVTFKGTAITAEGYNGGNSPNDSRDDWTTGAVLLGTSNPELVKTAVPKSGGSFFTGIGGVSLSSDPIATTVTLPTSSTYTTATIQEGTAVSPLCTNFLVCLSSTLDIPGTFTPYMSVVVRLDKSNIKPGTKIESVLVYHNGALVGDCASPTTPGPSGLCIAKRTTYKNKSVAGWTADLDGDFEWLLIGPTNGVLEFF